MRETKYRAWDIDEKCWIPKEACHLDTDGKLWTFDINEARWIIETISYEIVFYTGLKDKNGNPLDWWEGDIARKNNDALAEIIFHNGCFMGRWINHELPLFYFNQNEQRTEWFEIIGNIYESPGLSG